MVIDWWEYYQTGLEVGWTTKRIMIGIQSGFEDCEIDGSEVLLKIKYLVSTSKVSWC
jgi:hypothetical protein